MSYITDSFDERVIELLKSGGVGFMPSDTIYGLSCLALNDKAVERIRKLKDRSSGKPFIVLISEPEQLVSLGVDVDQTKVMDQYWPGKISLECSAPKAPSWLHLGMYHFAVRVPDYPELLKLIKATGPIVSTSANLQGLKPIESVSEAQKLFGNQLDFYIDIGDLRDQEPSTIVVLENGQLKVDRPGAVKIDS